MAGCCSRCAGRVPGGQRDARLGSLGTAAATLGTQGAGHVLQSPCCPRHCSIPAWIHPALEELQGAELLGKAG